MWLWNGEVSVPKNHFLNAKGLFNDSLFLDSPPSNPKLTMQYWSVLDVRLHFQQTFRLQSFFSVHRTMFLCFLRKKVIQTDIDGNFHKRNYVQKGFCFFCWIKDRYNYHCLLFVHHIGTCLQYSIGKNICRPIFVYCLLSVGGCWWQKSRPLLFVFLFSRP